jgi:hypothetical protein
MATEQSKISLKTPKGRQRCTLLKPYTEALDAGLHLLYRRGRSGGKWYVRRPGIGKRYAVEKIGVADDNQDANGEKVFSYTDAPSR